MDIRLLAGARVLLATLAMTGCTSAGLELDDDRIIRASSVAFEWHGTDNSSGNMTARIADGRVFDGPYLLISRETPVDRLAPLYEGWSAHWGWRRWQSPGGPKFLQHYDGKVLANLLAPSGERMRCWFRLDKPSSGIDGGGSGDCELSDGKVVNAHFPAARVARFGRDSRSVSAECHPIFSTRRQ